MNGISELIKIVWHADGSFSFPYVNDASKKLYDIAPEDLVADATLLTRLMHPDDRQRFDASVKQSLVTLQPWREVLRLIVNGEVRWYDCMSRSRPELQPNGDIVWDGIVLEITDRMKAVESLKESEQKLAEIIAQNPHPFWISNAKGNLIRINKSCCDLLDIQEEDVLGRYNVLQDEIVIEQGFLPLVQSVYNEGKTANFTIEYASTQLKHIQPGKEGSCYP